MRPRPNLKTIITAKFSTFCEHSSLHGVYYFHSRQHWFVYAVWGVVVAAGVGLCTVLSHMIWLNFIIDPTFTVVQSARYPTAKIPFPSVTICDIELVYGPNTENVTHILELRGYDIKQIHHFYRSLTDVKLRDYAVDAKIKKMHMLLHDLGYTLAVLMDMLNKPCDVLIARCVWRSRYHNCSEMFRQVYTFGGYCCQFDMAYFKEHAATDTNFIAGMEPTEALDITVYGQNVSAAGTIADGFVQFYISDPQNKPTLVDTGLTLTPAGYFDVDILIWAIDSSDAVKALPKAIRKCVLETDTDSEENYYQGCMAMHVVKNVVDICRCIPFNYSSHDLKVENVPPCTWDRLVCIYQNIEKIKSDFGNLKSEEECLQKCDYIQYITNTDYLKHQRHFKIINESFSRVTIHISSNTCLKYRREVLYTWDQMLANLGGIFGLCLGGSVISIIELIWFIIDLLFTIITSFGKNDSLNLVEKDRIFTLTRKNLVSKNRKPTKGVYQFAN